MTQLTDDVSRSNGIDVRQRGERQNEDDGPKGPT